MNRTMLSIAGLSLSLAATAPIDARKLQLEDYLNLERVTAPQISPDGKSVVYTRSWVNLQEDRFENELWVMDANGDRNRRLLKAAKEVRWSPDGSRIVYTDAAGQGNEIFVRWMDAAGHVSQITRDGRKPQAPSWSPDGKWIAYLAKVPSKAKWSIELPGKPNGARWTDDAVVIDQLHYRLDGTGHTSGEYTHVFVVSAEGGTPKQLTQGEWHAEPRRASIISRGTLEWTRDGRSIIFSADREPDADSHYARAGLYAVDVADGRIRSIADREGFWGLSPGPRVSPDGKWVAYVGTGLSTTSNYPALELHVVSIDGTGDRLLIDDLPGSISSLFWDKSGKRLYYSVGERGYVNVRSVSLSGGTKTVTQGAQSIVLSSVSDNGIAVGTLTSAHQPPDIVRLNLKDGQELRTVTAMNADVLGEVELGRVEELWYDSTDNTKVQGWIVYPPDFDRSKKYPLILDIHGGPEAMYEGNFQFTYQDMAAHGYIVLYTNPRGSSGYGSAFARTIYDAYPGRVDYEDLMAGVDAVLARGLVDEQRMYVQGCSGGGTLTAWVVTQTDRFAGAAALCPIVNMISFAGASDIPAWAFNRYKKPFWEDPSAWLSSSSIMHIDRVKTPTLVMVGEFDIRTPVGQAEELYTGLKMVGVPTKLILVQEEWHGTSSRPSNLLRTQLYLRKWYGEWRREMQAGKPHWRSVSQTALK